ncbi:hypothetical protein PSQ90_00150 [Devosia rhodophyticola]|uniref:Outer membrane immunogenic protein n=1 Tax=Devosia rhodophyticola TaxID=3026423 RepID=A0ABY7YX76_9HYPH|nr:hypothetical protein [Devosia rhodophyticola]WDR05921.1 hypothetical protein PSQ90_00150 [Devosia rhodophyticola]
MFVRSLSFGVAAAALMVSGAQAADLMIPTTPQPVYQANGFSWEGLYAGIEAGGVFNGTPGVVGLSAGNTQGVIGGIVGVNFIVADPIVLGLEVQGDYVFGSGNDSGLFLALAHVGVVATDNVLVYAAAGAGAVTNSGTSTGVYALGGGVDVAVTDSVSVRGEILGLGDFDGGSDDFFESAKATVGVFYHF